MLTNTEISVVTCKTFPKVTIKNHDLFQYIRTLTNNFATTGIANGLGIETAPTNVNTFNGICTNFNSDGDITQRSTTTCTIPEPYVGARKALDFGSSPSSPAA